MIEGSVEYDCVLLMMMIVVGIVFVVRIFVMGVGVVGF